MITQYQKYAMAFRSLFNTNVMLKLETYLR